MMIVNDCGDVTFLILSLPNEIMWPFDIFLVLFCFCFFLNQPIGCLSLIKMRKNIRLMVIVNDCGDITFFKLFLPNKILK